MPLASLSTLAVMKPGPTTAKNNRIRVFQRLRKFMLPDRGMTRTYSRRFRINGLLGFREGEKLASREFDQKLGALQFRAEHGDHIIRCDNPRQTTLVVYHWQREQVVFVEQLDIFLLFCIGAAGDQGILD